MQFTGFYLGLSQAFVVADGWWAFSIDIRAPSPCGGLGWAGFVVLGRTLLVVGGVVALLISPFRSFKEKEMVRVSCGARNRTQGRPGTSITDNYWA